MWFLAGCKEASDPAQAVGWELGASQVCEASQPPSWELLPVAETWDAPTEEMNHGLEPGGIAVIGEDVWFARPDGSLGMLDAESGFTTAHTHIASKSFVSFALGDFDQNGVEDVVIPNAGQILWDGEVQSVLWNDDELFIADAAALDQDHDGDLDLLASWRTRDPGAGTLRQPMLFRNEGDRTFSHIPVEGADSWGVGFEVSAMDADGDTTPDVYICNDMGTVYEDNVLLTNRAGTLSVAPDPLGLDLGMSCMGTAWGDVDHDGRMDLVIADLYRFWVMRNTPSGFTDVSAAMGLPTWIEEQKMAWGILVQDVDDDGYVEILS